MKKKLMIFVITSVSIATPAFAILGVGDIVFDPTNFQKAVQEVLTLEQQYLQLIAMYKMLTSQYDQMVWMSKKVPVNMPLRYQALATLWRLSSATNTYGTTGGWISGINTGLAVPTGYASATQPLGAYGAVLGNIPGDQL